MCDNASRTTGLVRESQIKALMRILLSFMIISPTARDVYVGDGSGTRCLRARVRLTNYACVDGIVQAALGDRHGNSQSRSAYIESTICLVENNYYTDMFQSYD